jgi:predicted transglutaminase-like cysteine proteinase
MGVSGKARSLAHIFAAVLGLASAAPMAGEIGAQPAGERIQLAAVAAPSSMMPLARSPGREPSDPAAPESLSYSLKWRGAAVAIANDLDVLARCHAAPDACPETAMRFLAMVHEARDRHGRARLGEVNRAINLAIRFTSDAVQHGVDVWASPLETVSSGRGDCEDYAILKITALRELGMPASDLRLVVMRDIRLQQDHAVAMARLDGRWIVLDNRRLVLLEPEALHGYTALSAFEAEDRPDLAASVVDARAARPVRAPSWPAAIFNPS